MAERTKWVCGPSVISEGTTDVVTDENPERLIATVETEADAEYIVRACNNHDALVAALILAQKYLESHRPKGNIRKIFTELNEYENGVMKPIRVALIAAGAE